MLKLMIVLCIIGVFGNISKQIIWKNRKSCEESGSIEYQGTILFQLSADTLTTELRYEKTCCHSIRVI